MNENAMYGAILLTQRNVRWLAGILSVVATIAPFVVAWFLGVPLWSVILGLLVATGITFAFGVPLTLILNKVAIEWTMDHSDVVSIVLGYVSMIAGMSIFIGLLPAFFVVTTPMVFTVPTSYGLRRWALNRYQDDVLWESMN